MVEDPSSQNSNIKSLARILTIQTILFIILTAPIAISGGYFLTEMRASPTGFLILSIFNTLRFSHHCLNIFLLSFFNTEFRNALFLCFHRRKVDIYQRFTKILK
jgi:hypothetical protein